MRSLSKLLPLLVVLLTTPNAQAQQIGPGIVGAGSISNIGHRDFISMDTPRVTAGGCSNSLNFSAACNSQYINVVLVGL